MTEPKTSYRGPLGSTIYRLEADAATVAALADLDWSSHFPRVGLDPVREVVVFLTPSPLRERLTRVCDDLVDAAAEALGRASTKLGSARLRAAAEPPGSGLEPDCAFFFGDRACGYIEAVAESPEAPGKFLEENGPDLLIEVEMTGADEGKIARYADFGVREFWRIDGRRGEETLRARFLALGRGAPPRPLAASEVLPGLTPSGVGAAAEALLFGRRRGERTEAVERLVRRARQPGFPPRDEERADRVTGPAAAPAPGAALDA